MTPQELIIHTLMYSQPYFKELCKDLIAQRNELKSKEDPSLHKDIDSQFVSMVKSTLAKDLAMKHAISTEEILIVLESINIIEYMK